MSSRAARRSTALVVAACDPGEVARLPPAELVIAADGGVDVARRAARRVDAVIGDLDSASAVGLAWARACGARVIRYPPRKDVTDLELALRMATEHAVCVHVVASAGGRLDHALANLLVLASPRWAAATLSATVGTARVDVVRGRRRIPGRVGDCVSLLAVGGPARVARTRGLEYPLAGETLSPTSGRGVSNVITDAPAVVDVTGGVLLAVNPNGAGLPGSTQEARRQGTTAGARRL